MSDSSLRACYFCSLIKSLDDFVEEGCDNCKFIRDYNDEEVMKQITTTNFSGVIAMNNPTESWVARWQRISGNKYIRGLYAVSVSGYPPNDYVNLAERKGYHYINRDQHYDPKRTH